MGFSLSGFLKKSVDQVNPFDNGKSFQNQNVPPPPATTRQVQSPIQHAMGNVSHAIGNTVNAGARIGTGVVDQVNQFDGGRTFKQTTPQNYRSVFQQTIHNGATNVAGMVAKPLLRTGQAVTQGIGNAELALAGRPTKNADDYFGTLNKATDYTGTKRQIASDAAQTALTVATPGVGKVVEKSFAAVAPKVVPNIVTKTVTNAGTGAIVGAPFNAAAYLGGNQPVTAQGLKDSAVQGAQFGAALGAATPLLGAAGKVAAPVVAQGVRQATPIVAQAARNAGAATTKLVQNVNEKALSTPEVRANLADQAALRDYSDYLSGAYNPGTNINAVIAAGQAAAEKHGIQGVRTADVATRMDAINGVLDNLGKQRTATMQGGYLRLPGRPTELMTTHNLSEDNLAHAANLGGIPQASIGIIDPRRSAIDGFGNVTLVGNEKLVDPKISGTRTYASDVYSVRQPKGEIQAGEGTIAKLRQQFKAANDKYGKSSYIGFDSADNLLDGMANEPSVIAHFLEKNGIKPDVTVDAASNPRYAFTRQMRDAGLGDKFQQFLEKTARDAGAESKIFAGWTNSGQKRLLPENMDNILNTMRKERLKAGESFFGSSIGGIRGSITPKFKSLEDIYKAKDRLTTTEKMEATKEVLENKLNDFQGMLEKYVDPKTVDGNQYTEFDRQLSSIGDYLRGGSDRKWFHQKFPNAPAEVIKKLDDFKKEIQTAPTEYFESVSDRAVKLNEFEKALVPENASQATLDRLKANGIQPIVYKEGERQKMLQQLMKQDNVDRGFVSSHFGSHHPTNRSRAVDAAKKLLTPLDQSGHIQIRADKQPKAAKSPVDSSVASVTPTTKLVKPNTDHLNVPTVKNYINEYADALKQMDDTAQGGNKFKRNANGTPVMSEKSPFFTNHFAEHGKAPTKADYQAEATRQFETGKADSYAQSEYSKIVSDAKNPEVQSLVNQVPEKQLTPIEQNQVAATKLKRQVKEDYQERVKNDSRPLPIIGEPVSVKSTIRKEVNPTSLKQEQIAELPKGKQSKVQLNTKRLNTDEQGAANLAASTNEIVEKMSNKDVERIAKSAGLDTKTYNVQQTRQKIAEQLNVRQAAVRLQREAQDAMKAGDPGRAATLLEKSAELGRTSREQGTDLARQLQARRIIANELDTPQQRIFKLLDNAGVNPKVYSERLAKVNFDNPKEVIAAYRELVPAKASNWLDTVRYNSMLSSPLTQAVNIFGNAQNVALVAPIEKTLRGGVDAVRSAVFGGERQYAAGEGAAYAGGVATNISNASRNFVDALRGTGKYANADLEEFAMPLATKGIKGVAYKTLSAPMKILDGFDKFFRTLAESGEDAALNLRQKKGIAIQGDRSAIKEAEAAYRVFQTEIGEPGQGIFNNTADEFAKGIMKYRSSKNPVVSTVAKFSVPFVRTINNISKQGLVDYSPMGFVNMAGHADKVTAFTRATMGTAIFGASAALLASDKMTWAEPRDAEERARFRAEGKQPYAIKMGDKWVNFSKLTPSVAFPMAMTAALNDAMKEKKLDQGNVDAILEAVSKYGNFLSDQSYAKSIGDVLGAVGGDKEAVASAVSNNIQQLVPARAFSSWIARMSDDKERKVDTTQGYFDQQIELLMQQYPALRQNTTTRDYKGTPIAANNQVLNGISPVRITKDRGVDPLDAELDSAKVASVDDPDLNKKQQAQLKKYLQPKIADAQKQLIGTSQYQSLSAEDKAHALDTIKTQYGSAYTRQFKADNNVPLVKQASKSDEAILMNKNDIANYAKAKDSSGDYGTSTDDYYKSPDAEYKALLSDFERKSKAGEYNSPAKKIVAQNALDKAKAGAAFTKDIRDAYELTNDDLYDYVSNDKNGKKIAEDVIAYGDKLVAAGIIKKNKFKDKYGNVTLTSAASKVAASNAKGRKASNNKFAAALKSSNAAANSNQGALIKLVRGARVSSRSSRGKQLQVANVTLKKQTAKKQKVRA